MIFRKNKIFVDYIIGMNLDTFLHQYRVNKQSNPDAVITHTSLGSPAGSFSIPIEEKETLCELIYHQVFKRKIPCHLTEAPQPHSNIKVDLDFRFPLEKTKRFYKISHIESIVQLYNDAIKNYLDVSDDKMLAFIFERRSPYDSGKGYNKDGIHIIYPYIVCHTDIQHLIRKHVLSNCSEVLDSIESTNSYEDIIDKCIIDKNNWLMYGCCKLSTKPYSLTHVYDIDFEDLKDDYQDVKDLLLLLSIRDHPESSSVPIKSDKAYLLINDTPKIKSIKINKNVTKIGNNGGNNNDKDMVKQYSKLFSVERATNYSKWVNVGIMMKTISNDLFESWVEFSQTGTNYDESYNFQCKWNSFTVKDYKTSFKALRNYAISDNSIEFYNKFQDKDLNDLIDKSCCMTTEDVARIFEYLYKDYFKCDGKDWYYFNGSTWITKNAVEDFKKKFPIVVELIAFQMKLLSNQSIELVNKDDKVDELNKLNDKIKQMLEVTFKLRDITFKNKIVEECRTMFQDSDIASKMNSNPMLLGFDNGVYDFNKWIFRPIEANDYISFTCGYDYTDEVNASIKNDIFSFFNQVFTDSSVRDYILSTLSLTLYGQNPLEEFYLWVGVGGNGKSKITELHSKTLGGEGPNSYSSKIPIAYFTGKRTSSSSATPELDKIIHKRLVTCQESDRSDYLNTGVVKDFCGNDAIQSRGLFKSAVDVKPQHKPFYSCNKLPLLNNAGDDGGLWRRLVVIKFESLFLQNPNPNKTNEFQRDNNIHHKFDEWRQQYMLILIEYLKSFINKNSVLPRPDKINDWTNTYRRESDEIITFKADYIVRDSDSTIKIGDAYSAYMSSRRLMGHVSAKLNRNQFKDSLSYHLGQYDIKNGWTGFKLIEIEPVITENTTETSICALPITNVDDYLSQFYKIDSNGKTQSKSLMEEVIAYGITTLTNSKGIEVPINVTNWGLKLKSLYGESFKTCGLIYYGVSKK